jgi:hypothetical protein
MGFSPAADMLARLAAARRFFVPQNDRVRGGSKPVEFDG